MARYKFYIVLYCIVLLAQPWPRLVRDIGFDIATMPERVSACISMQYHAQY